MTADADLKKAGSAEAQAADLAELLLPGAGECEGRRPPVVGYTLLDDGDEAVQEHGHP